ncbi:virulence RhuM family protein [Phocaeicola sp.]
MEQQGEIILYQPDETVKMEVRIEDETVWLTQAQIAELFGTKRPAITKHLNNIYKSGELDENSTCSILEHMGNDGKQKYITKLYNLDVILSIGYRVNSKNATLFRRWANQVLKDYLLKGYAINQRLNSLEQKVDAKFLSYDIQLTKLNEKIDFFVRTSLPPIEGIFFDGQIFDAYTFATNLIKSAKSSLILIDNYVDENTLLMLSKRTTGVNATIYTQRITPQLQLDLTQHNNQYPPINIRTYRQAHDRFLIIDNSDVYHIGASLKDLGKKLFAFSKMEVPASVLTNLL